MDQQELKEYRTLCLANGAKSMKRLQRNVQLLHSVIERFEGLSAQLADSLEGKEEFLGSDEHRKLLHDLSNVEHQLRELARLNNASNDDILEHMQSLIDGTKAFTSGSDVWLDTYLLN